MNKHYLVTGGAGFIGSHLVERLCIEGHTVTVLDDLSTGKRENLPDNVIFFQGSICNQALVHELMSSVDTCFHLAAIASVPKSHDAWYASHQVNVGGSVNLLEAAKKHKVPFIYASSSAVYGNNTALPLIESTTTQALSAYAIDKLATEGHARIASTLFQIPTVGLRFFNVFGPRQDPSSPYSGVISIFFEKMRTQKSMTIFGNGLQTRDFIYVHDVVRALLLAEKQAKNQAKVVNICTGKATSLLTLHEILQKLTHTQLTLSFSPEREGDIKHSYGDPSFANKLLKFKAEIALEKGLRDLLKYTQSH